MKVALLGPIAWRTPPRAYGPWEQIVSLLAEGLVARGVDVTLFASLDSVTAARLDGVVERPYNEDSGYDGRVWEAIHVAHCYARSGEFDLVHNNLDWLPLAMSDFCRTRLVTTVHGFCSPAILPAYQRADSAFVSISDADRGPGLDYAATIYHGIDVRQFPFVAAPGETLVAFGRIHPDKGTADAIRIVRAAGRRLLICGPVHDERYHAEEVLPLVDGDTVVYGGNVGPQQRAEILGNAAALLHPIGFAEPFGLSVVEAMACGTPVVAYPLGSMPEVVDPGVTGFLATSVADAVAILDDALKLDRVQVRARALERFSADRMVDDYLRLYERLLR
ncbi:glycosyltransferase family 4 protein [Dactylosporangium fulvum]|uniref:Glycosyltransferase family 4 protein n=1 Tax=Dactylosporangium fulvum TaxID=53359 RepID=A0ABY5W683_9ACTN|nr:glycosyltransferase family 4 protein [Dactylosporangium fulvum]UWP84601.1 glycosyltransferase family 4 protein [Dactylosporangium fulvum]